MMDHAHVNKLGKKNAFSQSPRADRRAAAAKAGEGGMPRCYVAGMKEGRKAGTDLRGVSGSGWMDGHGWQRRLRKAARRHGHPSHLAAAVWESVSAVSRGRV